MKPLKPIKGRHMFGLVKIGEKGQILIPKEAREIFNLRPGDKLLLLGDEARGLALVKADIGKLFEAALPEEGEEALFSAGEEECP